MEKEAKRNEANHGDQTHQCDLEDAMDDHGNSIIAPTQVEPPKVETSTSQGYAQTEPMTRRRYYDETETLIQLQRLETKRRKKEERSLKGEVNRRIQGGKVESSKLQASSSSSSTCKRPKLNEADAPIERLLRAGSTPTVKRVGGR